MSDLATLRAVLKAELHTNSPYIDLAIADAIRFVRNEPLWFNGERYTFSTVADKYSYDLPEDFLGVRGDFYCTPDGSTASGRYTLMRKSADEIEALLYTSSEWDGFATTGRPKMIGIDLASRKVLVAPIPSDGGDDIYFKYTKDLGTPTYTATTSSSTPPSLATVVTLKDPDGSAISSTFTNEWFTEGFVLVQARALYELWTRFHGGGEGTMARANSAMTRYLEERNRLYGETSRIGSTVTVRRRL